MIDNVNVVYNEYFKNDYAWAISYVNSSKIGIEKSKDMPHQQKRVLADSELDMSGQIWYVHI